MKRETKTKAAAAKKVDNTALAPAPKKPMGYYVPASLMDKIINYIAHGPWMEVNELITLIQTNAQAVHTKTNENEDKNNTTPKA